MLNTCALSSIDITLRPLVAVTITITVVVVHCRVVTAAIVARHGRWIESRRNITAKLLVITVHEHRKEFVLERVDATLRFCAETAG